MPVNLLDKVRAALKRPTPTVPQLADAVADARKADDDARAAVDKAASVVAAGFMDGDTKRATDRATLAAAREAAEDAGLVLAEAERRHAAAVAADADAARRVVYEGAKAQAAAAALALSKSYPALARGLVAMLKDLAEAQAAVVTANAALPAGAEPLVDPETSARAVMALPREVVSDEVVERWSRLDQDVPVDDAFAAEIYATGNGWGRRESSDVSLARRGTLSQGEPQAAYRMRRFRRVEYREAVPGAWTQPLALALRLPAVRGDGFLWGSASSFGFDPLASAALRGDGEPGAVLARVAEVETAAVAKPVEPDRAVKVEWSLIGEVVPFPASVALETTRAQPSPSAGSRFGASPLQPAGARAGGRR